MEGLLRYWGECNALGKLTFPGRHGNALNNSNKETGMDKIEKIESTSVNRYHIGRKLDELIDLVNEIIEVINGQADNHANSDKQGVSVLPGEEVPGNEGTRVARVPENQASVSPGDKLESEGSPAGDRTPPGSEGAGGD